MFIHLKGHHVLDYYFGLSDSRIAANEPKMAAPDRPARIVRFAPVGAHAGAPTRACEST